MIFEWVDSDQVSQWSLGEWPASATWSDEQVGDHLRSRPFLGARAEGQLAALILFQDLDGVIEIQYLFTHPRFRRMGLMESLLCELIRRYPTSKIWLEVHAANQGARQLYGKMGFKSSGLRRGYYRDGGDGILLERPPKSLAVS